MTTLDIINLKKLRITPVYIVFSDEGGFSQNLAFGELLHKAMETCLYRIDEENIKNGKSEILFAAKTLTDDQISTSKLLADMQNSFPRGYSLSWETVNVPDHFVLRINLFGAFAKVLPYMLARLENFFSRLGYHKIKFVSVYDTTMKALELKRGKVSPAPKVIKLYDFEIPEHKLKQICMNILSPVKLYKTQIYNFNMGFGDFVYHLLKRMVLIQYLYCEGPLPEPELFKQTCEDLNYKAETAKLDLEFVHQRLSKNQPLEGYVGTIIYRMNSFETFNNIIPILKFGEYLQVGSSTNYGMGRFKIEPL